MTDEFELLVLGGGRPDSQPRGPTAGQEVRARLESSPMSTECPTGAHR